MKKKIDKKKERLSDEYIDREYSCMDKRRLVLEEVDEYNAAAERKAIDRFLKGAAGDTEQLVRLIRDKLQGNLRLIRNGNAPYPLSAFLANSLQRTLSTRTYVEYSGRNLPYGFASEDHVDEAVDIPIADLRAEAYDCELSAIPTLHEQWQGMVNDLSEFLYAAAVFAKSIGSAAARLYLRAWFLVEEQVASYRDDEIPCYPWPEFSADSAQRIVRLERVATERLKVDAMFADLPAFSAYVRKAKAKGGKQGR